MSAISDLSDVIRLGTSGTEENVFFNVDARYNSDNTAAGVMVAPIAGRWMSMWTHVQSPGRSGRPPGAVVAPTTSTGGILFRNASSGKEKWLISAFMTCRTLGAIILYDRLLHIGGLSGTSTSAQTVGGTLTRHTNGLGNVIWAEIYDQVGTSATTISASYTNSTGVSGRTTVAQVYGGTGYRESTRILPLQLANGDYGVQAVASATLAASSGTAGNWGITVAHPIATFLLPTISNGVSRDYLSSTPGPIKIEDDSCLCLAFLANGVNVPSMDGSLHFLEK